MLKYIHVFQSFRGSKTNIFWRGQCIYCLYEFHQFLFLLFQDLYSDLSNIVEKDINYWHVPWFSFKRKKDLTEKQFKEDMSTDLQTLAEELSITGSSPQEIIEAACR